VVRAAEDVQISSIIVTDTVSSGVMVDAGSERVSLSEVAVFDADFDGVTVQASARVRIEKSTLSGNGGAGVSFDWGVVDAEVLSTTITSNGRTWGGGDNPGVYMAMTSNSSLTGNTISRNDGNGVVLTNQGMAEVPSQTCASDNVFRGNTLEGNGQFAFWLTHATCTGNRSIDNATLRNAWGPIFEPVCGQMETVAATCEGAGCATTCGG
jgi:parallel beta-helix repeat protein